MKTFLHWFRLGYAVFGVFVTCMFLFSGTTILTPGIDDVIGIGSAIGTIGMFQRFYREHRSRKAPQP